MKQWDKLQKQLRTGSIGRREFLSAAAALGISNALTSHALAQTPKRGGHLILGLDGASSSDSLDPALTNTDYMAISGSQLYDAFTYVDEHTRVQPGLAESWDAKSGAKEWVFKLRRGVTFHNGKPMTPADVVYSINHHRGKDSKSALRAMFASISDVKVTDKDEITITLAGGDADVPYLLADWHLGIVPEGSNFTDGVGTGAFILESFEPGVRMRVKRNPNDWRANRGYVESVETLAINDPTARLSALISGSVHLINKVGPNFVETLEKIPQIQVLNVSGAGHLEFAMLCDTPPFDNLDLRLALKYAIDRQTDMKTVLRGYGKIGNDQPIPSFDPFYAADIPQRPYDPEKAKFHFKKSGHSGSIVLTVADVAFPGAVDMAVIFRASAAKAGIDIQVNRVPNDGYYDEIWLKNPFSGAYNGGRPTAGLMFSYAYISSAPNNYTHWRRPKFDELLIMARAELDTAKRKQMYHDLQLMVHEEGGSIIPAFNNFIDAGSKKVRNFTPDPSHDMSGNRAPEKVWLEV